MKRIDLLIHSAAQVLTCASASTAAKRGAALADVGIIADGAVAIHDGHIVEAGASTDLRARYSADETVDASGCAICPGFVDSHTHVLYAGDRAAEFELRIKGATYLEILAAGGGILSTMRATRDASPEALMAQTRGRLLDMRSLGSTTVEIKTGYGLSVAHELKCLRAIETLAGEAGMPRIVPTFLGAHAVPPEFKHDPDGYVDLIVNDMVPAVAQWHAGSRFASRPLFIDVFCEKNAFSLAQMERVLRAGLAFGMRVKAHVDQFTSLGGVGLAKRLGAISVDHLEVTTDDDIATLAASDMVGVLIPVANFNLAANHHAPARKLVDAGAAIALCTDMNPGSAPCPSMPFAMAVATRYMKLTPAEALHACTINAAHALGLAGEIGSLEPGKRADLLVLRTGDYRHLSYYIGVNPIQRVIMKGALIG